MSTQEEQFSGYQSTESNSQNPEQDQIVFAALRPRFSVGQKKTPHQLFQMQEQIEDKRLDRLLNKLTWKNFEKLMREFDFQALVKSEPQKTLAHSFSLKVRTQQIKHEQTRKNPMESELYLVVLRETCQAYTPNEELPVISNQPLSYGYLQPSAQQLCDEIAKALLTESAAGELEFLRQMEEENKLSEDEISILRSGALGPYKMLGDMVFVGFLPIDCVLGIIQEILLRDELNQLDLAKIIVLLCSLQKLNFDSSELHQFLFSFCQESLSIARGYHPREKIQTENAVADLLKLAQSEFRGDMYLLKPVIAKLYANLFGMVLVQIDLHYIWFHKNQ